MEINNNIAAVIDRLTEIADNVDDLSLDAFTRYGGTKRNIELYVGMTVAEGTRNNLEKFMKDKCPTFKAYRSQQEYDVLDQRLIKIMSLHGTTMRAWLIGDNAAKTSTNSMNVIETACAFNQRNLATVSFQYPTYTITAKESKIQMEVENMGVSITPAVKDFLEKNMNQQRVEKSSAESNLLSYAVQIAFSVEKKDDGSVLDLKDKPPREGMSGIRGVGKERYDSMTMVAMKGALSNFRGKVNSPDLIYRAVAEIVEAVKEKSPDTMNKLSATCNREPMATSLDTLMKMDPHDLQLKAGKMKPAVDKIATAFDVGNTRVSTSLKMVPPLAYLAGDICVVPDARKVACYMGASGLAHMRVTESYFDVINHAYDINGMTPKKDDRTTGAYTIKSADFYSFAYRYVDLLKNEQDYDTLIDDVYSNTLHGVGKVDDGMFCKTTCLLQNGIFSQKAVDGVELTMRNLKLKRVMAKGRLPVGDNLKRFAKCYPFIVCRTTGMTETEAYYVKFFGVDADNRLKETYKTVTAQFKEMKSKNIDKYCFLVQNEGQFISMIKVSFSIAIFVSFIINQFPVLNPQSNYKVHMARDWPIRSDQMPVCFVPKEFRGTLNFMNQWSQHFEMSTLSYADAMKQLVGEIAPDEKEEGEREMREFEKRDNEGKDAEDAAEIFKDMGGVIVNRINET